jgi:hypothetical protein
VASLVSELHDDESLVVRTAAISVNLNSPKWLRGRMGGESVREPDAVRNPGSDWRSCKRERTRISISQILSQLLKHQTKETL